MNLEERMRWYVENNSDIPRILKNYPELKKSYDGSHDVGAKSHTTDVYKFRLFADPEIYLHWSYCPDCGHVRQKYLLSYGKRIEKQVGGKEIAYDTAFVLDIIKDGKEVN